MKNNEARCEWSRGDVLMEEYHDNEWGVPLYDDGKLFEYLILDMFQAGLSWKTVLHKRIYFREAFNNFNAHTIALYNTDDVQILLNNKGIIRNKLKIQSAITSAKLYIKIQKEHGNFCSYIWQFVDGHPNVNKWKTVKEIPPFSIESQRMSEDLKKKGFSFVGPVICYAYMQATGMVNDHTMDCFRYNILCQQ